MSFLVFRPVLLKREMLFIHQQCYLKYIYFPWIGLLHKYCQRVHTWGLSKLVSAQQIKILSFKTSTPFSSSVVKLTKFQVRNPYFDPFPHGACSLRTTQVNRGRPASPRFWHLTSGGRGGHAELRWCLPPAAANHAQLAVTAGAHLTHDSPHQLTGLSGCRGRSQGRPGWPHGGNVHRPFAPPSPLPSPLWLRTPGSPGRTRGRASPPRCWARRQGLGAGLRRRSPRPRERLRHCCALGEPGWPPPPSPRSRSGGGGGSGRGGQPRHSPKSRNCLMERGEGEKRE